MKTRQVLCYWRISSLGKRSIASIMNIFQSVSSRPAESEPSESLDSLKVLQTLHPPAPLPILQEKPQCSSDSQPCSEVVAVLTLSEMFVDLLLSSTLKGAIGIPLATTYQFSSFRTLLSFLMSSMQESQSLVMRFPKLRQLTITFGTSSSCIRE